MGFKKNGFHPFTDKYSSTAVNDTPAPADPYQPGYCRDTCGGYCGRGANCLDQGCSGACGSGCWNGCYNICGGCTNCVGGCKGLFK